MTANPSASDWARARGEQWLRQLTGMEAMLRPIDEPLIAALQLDAPLRIAELGCGGGGTAIEVSRRAPAGSVVHGFDLSTALIERARARTEPNERLRFEVADVASATPHGAYQRLLSRFGIMFFDEPRAAFLNLSRWLEPGGRFAFAVWGSSSENRWLSGVREVLGRIIGLPEPDLEAPGPFRYADVSRLLALLEAAGFVELDGVEWRGALPIGGGAAPEATEFALAAFSSFGELLTKAGDASLTEARRALTAYFAGQERDGVVYSDARVHVVSGVRR